MSSLAEALGALWPLAAAVTYFIVVYLLVDRAIVRKKLLNDYQLKAIDLAWVWVSATQLAFLVLSVREGVLRDRISSYETQSAAVRDTYLDKTKDGTSQCMAGTWPAGAIKGKSYQENGNRVTEACTGVSGALDLFSGFFRDEQLWRYPPSPTTAAKFEKAYDSAFGSGFAQAFARLWTPPRAIDQLALEAKDQFADAASRIVTWQSD
ncbi:MAG TPA: hypothetical protein VL985_08595, partial [Stellaceae bacterium]|nr:hypothetical protein [Stellaceae bacterium]